MDDGYDFKLSRLIDGLLTKGPLTGKIMGISVKHKILFLVIISSVFISLPEVKGGCAGGCSISGGGGSSTSFMGDRATSIDMPSFDEFVRDNLGSNIGATLQAKSPSVDSQFNDNSSINQTGNSNSSQNSSAVMPLINGRENMTSDGRTVKLGTTGMQGNKLSTKTSAAFNNNMFWQN
jgi:hypothetical protein